MSLIETLIDERSELKSEITRLRAELEAETARAERFAAMVIQARAAAIEECARIAETLKSSPVYFVDGRPNAAPVIGGQHIAAAIRARAAKEGTE